jgi:hypothetical protein
MTFSNETGFAILAVQRTHDLAHSAMPDAPVLREPEVPDRPLRRRLAVALHRLADRLEPRPSRSAEAC